MDTQFSLADYETFLKKLVHLRSVSTDALYKKDVVAAHACLVEFLKSLDFNVQSFETKQHPIVWAQRLRKGAPHIVFYGHYDVQPVDPINLWESPPFELQAREGRLYGRGASDDKGPLCAILFAVARFLKKHPDAPLSLSFIIEGEEEIGSPNFETFLQAHRADLHPDLVMLSDSVSLSPQQPVLTIGLRGLTTFEIELEAAQADLHSGLFGGAAINPIHALCSLCATLHTEEGKVNIPGFYNEVTPPEPEELHTLASLPELEKHYQSLIGNDACKPPAGHTAAQAVRFLPTLEINGIGGGYQGEGSKTIIPQKAWAKISCRLVPNQDPHRLLDCIAQTLQKRCPLGTHLTLREGASTPPYFIASASRENSRYYHAAEKASQVAFGASPILLREGGSIGIVESIHRLIGCEMMLVGLSLPEDRIHSPNESFSLEMAEKGILFYQNFLESLL